jgi:chemotaxis receptor (MCP) glutamine deamidase CheD
VNKKRLRTTDLDSCVEIDLMETKSKISVLAETILGGND